MKRITVFLTLLAGLAALAMLDRQPRAAQSYNVRAQITDMDAGEAKRTADKLTILLSPEMGEGRATIAIWKGGPSAI